MLGTSRSRWLPCVFLAAAVWGVGPVLAGDDGGSNAPATAAAGTFDHQVKSLLGTYCVGCHGPTKQKGDRRFDRLDGDIADDDALVDLQDILDQLNLGDMPPKEAPAVAGRAAAGGRLADRAGSSSSTASASRRTSRRCSAA